MSDIVSLLPKLSGLSRMPETLELARSLAQMHLMYPLCDSGSRSVPLLTFHVVNGPDVDRMGVQRISGLTF